MATKMYFQEGFVAANSGDESDLSNYSEMSDLFGKDWQNKDELKIDLKQIYKNEGFSEEEINEEGFFDFYIEDGVSVYLIDENKSIDTNKLKFVVDNQICRIANIIYMTEEDCW